MTFLSPNVLTSKKVIASNAFKSGAWRLLLDVILASPENYSSISINLAFGLKPNGGGEGFQAPMAMPMPTIDIYSSDQSMIYQ